ncbi:hypothetical protein LCGC14_1022020 [marine sediment metagenome]|uniref:Uncharacterized protein n=1 Tax=marine sediment metagenome TaxID=412755 RepID=A0A0F9NIQ9_9ZZZZ|nr:hypothetical protein [bacterium]
MPSFQIYEIKKDFKIEDLKDKDVLNQIDVRDEDPQTLKKFIVSGKKNYRDLSFSPLNNIDAAIMKFDEKINFQDKQSLWVNFEKLIIKQGHLLLIGKTEKKIEKLIQIYLRDIASSKPVIFKDKQLWQIWRKLNSNSTDNLEFKLHRVILKNTFIDADKISELNIHANNVGSLGIIGDLIKQSERINAMTIKIKGFYSGNRWTTVRIDKSGSMLIYGKHESNIIIEFLDLLIQSI